MPAEMPAKRTRPRKPFRGRRPHTRPSRMPRIFKIHEVKEEEKPNKIFEKSGLIYQNQSLEVTWRPQ